MSDSRSGAPYSVRRRLGFLWEWRAEARHGGAKGVALSRRAAVVAARLAVLMVATVAARPEALS